MTKTTSYILPREATQSLEAFQHFMQPEVFLTLPTIETEDPFADMSEEDWKIFDAEMDATDDVDDLIEAHPELAAQRDELIQKRLQEILSK